MVGDPIEMSVIEHLRELRRRIIVSALAVTVGSVVCFIFYDWIFALFYRPFRELEETFGATLFINTLTEGFMIKLKLSIIAGVVVSFPVHAFNVVRFVFPGLTGRERRVIGITLLVSFVLVVFSFYYGYFYIVPITVRFFTGSGFIPERVGMLLNYGKNIFYILQFLLVTLVIFQLPVLLEILMILNVLKRRAVLRTSRYVVFAVFILSAVFTPPDFVSQLAVAIPLGGLFFLTLLVARIFRFGEGAREEEDVQHRLG